jgi:hypothetical protein
MQVLDAQIEIEAPADEVWRVLADFPSYPDWNPFVIRAEGEMRVGARLTVTIAAHGRKPVTFTPRVLAVEPGRSITWKGQWFLPGLFDGRHSLSVEPLGDDRSRFRTHEEVTGILLPFLGRAMRDSQLGFEDFCAALKTRAEKDR